MKTLSRRTALKRGGKTLAVAGAVVAGTSLGLPAIASTRDDGLRVLLADLETIYPENPIIVEAERLEIARQLRTIIGDTGLPAITGNNPDAELLACVADFWTAYEKSDKAYDDWMARREEIEAMPGYPPDPPARLAHKDYSAFLKRRDEQDAFRGRHGNGEMADASNRACRECGKAANAVFAIPAQTVRGAHEKFRIARLATGIGEGTYTGDADLSCHQDRNAPWIDNALADLQRLSGGVS